MRAIALTRYLPAEDPQAFVEVELPKPAPRGHDLLVRVKAVSVNPVDVKVRSPRPAVEPEPRVLGWDAAGVVEEVGEAVTLFRPGDEVYYAGSIDRPGSDSEYQLVDSRIAGPKPRSLDFEAAAAMPLTTITAWEGLFERLGVPRDPAANARRSLLVIGGAGGVGSIAIQIAKRVAGLRVAATASRPESAAWAREMGADLVIDHRKSLRPQLEAADFGPADYIYCTSSTEHYIAEMAEAVAPQGKICLIAETKGDAPVNINLFQRKSATLAWELMFTRPLLQTADIQAQHDLLAEAARLFDAGVLRSTVTERFGPLSAESLRRAHARVETGAMIGKLVLGGLV
jgi:zinc-binding alcohol dehydrogenase family protein